MSRKKKLDAVASEIIVCLKCPLSKSRKNAVPGVGNQSRIILIGEAPGASEDAKGLPFVGRAGRFLDILLTKAGFSREQVFITNIVKCRPPQNRVPKPMEIETCTPYLERQIQIIRPQIVVTLGRYSTSYVLSRAGLPFTSMTQIHGKAYEVHFLGIPLIIFPSFHPASALYNVKYRIIMESDFKLLGSARFSQEHLSSSTS